VFKCGPERAARAAAWARVRRSACAPTPATQHARRLARKAGAHGAAGDDRLKVGEMLVGRQPARPGQELRGVLDARRAVGELPEACGVAVTTASGGGSPGPGLPVAPAPPAAAGRLGG
jgi:hypothetical protein